ncbi:MAG: type protein arginine methyltransferase [Solirubrobacteraceae bacterium]|nr:type protein arginine methyltransferase [Solirubrobacteraceae bacterium]
MGDLLEHRHYLEDARRFAAYDRALEHVARGKIVLDLGAGTGLLGLAALRHGARRVYGVESTGFADLTRAIAERNAAPGEYVVLRGSSRKIDLPEQVDVVLCDQLGAFICEGMPLPALADAARRHLRSGGRLMPETIEFGVQALRSQAVGRHLGFWAAPRFELDVSPLRETAVATPIYEHTRAAELAGPPASLGVLGAGAHADTLDLRTTVFVDDAGPVNGLAGFFTASLAPGVTITTRPADPNRIDRENIVLAIDPPIECSSGDGLDVRVRALLHSGVLAWAVHSAGEPPRRHSTWQGFTAAPIARG